MISLILMMLAAGCSAAEPPKATEDIQAAINQAVATLQSGGTQTAQVPATTTNTPRPTAIRTPPALPLPYDPGAWLNPLDTPHTYIKDTCKELKSKWDPQNAVPGTFIMPIMFHSITKGAVTNADQISMAEFHKLMNDLHDMGFQAIDMQQAADFLYNNAKIPQRSVLLIVDDRKYRAYFDNTFKQYFDQWGWKVVNSWISHPDTNQVLWAENVALEAEGWVDHEAHGVIHNINMNDNSSDAFIQGELQGSIDAFKTHFNKIPIAIIWPGGDFGKKPIQFARQDGYKLGFTINPRGPIMYNWIPNSDTADPARPSYISEGAFEDPLMTLPRYWDTDARAHLDAVRNLGNEAAAYAAKVKPTEMEYYDILCAATYGSIPQQ